MTKIVKNFAAQGEMYIRRVENFAAGETRPMKVERNNFILAHSETGHHHVVNSADVQVMERVNVPEGLGILHMIVENPTEIRHLRSNDTHESLGLEPGNYEIRLQREYTPEGYRRVAD